MRNDSACPAHAWPQLHLTHLPEGADAIDAFIGEPAMPGCGHGGRMLRQFAQMLLRQGAAAVVIDPDVHNHRALRAYARAGFVDVNVIDMAEGPAVVMVSEGT